MAFNRVDTIIFAIAHLRDEIALAKEAIQLQKETRKIETDLVFESLPKYEFEELERKKQDIATEIANIVDRSRSAVREAERLIKRSKKKILNLLRELKKARKKEVEEMKLAKKRAELN